MFASLVMCQEPDRGRLAEAGWTGPGRWATERQQSGQHFEKLAYVSGCCLVPELMLLFVAGLGVDKGALVTPGHPDTEGRGRRRWGAPTTFIDQVGQGVQEVDRGQKVECA